MKIKNLIGAAVAAAFSLGALTAVAAPSGVPVPTGQPAAATGSAGSAVTGGSAFAASVTSDDSGEDTESTDADRPEHRPGIETTYVRLGADAKLKNGQLHPCAGRKLLYHGHVDATYITRQNGKMDIMTVNGSEVLPTSEACMRLAPDADKSLNEVSRMVVPNNDNFSFLGSPGAILWHAPFQLIDGWRPIWAGFGAFDPTHEWDVPTDFVGDVVNLQLVGFDGPGDMEIWNAQEGWNEPARLISSKEKRRTTVGVGGHGHYNWTFTKPGIYKLIWVASGSHYDGSVERTEPVTQYWLVGSDEDVQIPSGTTTGLNSIGVTAEQQREQMGLTAPSDPSPAPVQISDKPAELTQDLEKVSGFKSTPPTQTIRFGSNFLKVWYDDFWQNANGGVFNEADNNIGRRMWVEVPDSELRCIKADAPWVGDFAKRSRNQWAWVTPAKGSDTAPSLGMDTTNLDYESLPPRGAELEVQPSDFENPRKSLIMTGIDNGDGFMPIINGWESRETKIPMLKPAKYNLRFAFSAPGVYKVDTDGRFPRPDTGLYIDYQSTQFVVGNKAINELRKAQGIKDLLPEGQVPSCSPENMLKGADPSKFVANGVDLPLIDPGVSAEDGSDDATEAPDDNAETSPEPAVEGTVEDEPTAEESATPDSVLTTPESGEGVHEEAGDEPPATGENPQPGKSPENPVEPKPVVPVKPTPEPKACTFAPDNPLRQAWGNNPPSDMLDYGHMDFSLQRYGDAVGVKLRDSRIGNEVEHESGKAALWLMDNSRTTTPNQLRGSGGFGDSAWGLPQSSIAQGVMPWVGFSTSNLLEGDYKPGTDVTVTLANFSGPGRMVTGHIGFSGDIDVKLDSADDQSKIVYPKPTHDHQAMWFSAPGLYDVTYQFDWTAPDGSPASQQYRVFYIVSSEQIQLTKQYIVHLRQGADCGTEVQPNQPEPQPNQPIELDRPAPSNSVEQPAQPPLTDPDEPGQPAPSRPTPANSETMPSSPIAAEPAPGLVTEVPAPARVPGDSVPAQAPRVAGRSHSGGAHLVSGAPGLQTLAQGQSATHSEAAPQGAPQQKNATPEPAPTAAGTGDAPSEKGTAPHTPSGPSSQVQGQVTSIPTSSGNGWWAGFLTGTGIVGLIAGVALLVLATKRKGSN